MVAGAVLEIKKVVASWPVMVTLSTQSMQHVKHGISAELARPSISIHAIQKVPYMKSAGTQLLNASPVSLILANVL